MLWTDASSREFIANEYPWFLDTFDGYTYPIQRADAIRYFVLHHYGGVNFGSHFFDHQPWNLGAASFDGTSELQS